MVDTRPGKLNPADVDHISEVRMVPSYPRGTVTFLLTDIEGSTALWEQSQVGMETALARHDETLRITIQQHSGSIFKTTGDGACAVFARAADALLAALDIQREITDHPASGTGPLRVRMALLTGVAEQRNDDYFGVVLNRASRLLALASGHQVLLGASTAELVWDHVPDGVELRSLGQRRLRGVKRPMEVYRVVAPYLPDDEPIREQTTSPVTDASQDGLFTRQDVSTSIRVHLLGTFRVLVNGRELTDDIWKKQKARQLLKCLLTRPHRRMTIDEAIDTFWPDAPDWDAAQKTLRSTLSALRSALGTTRAARGRGLVVTQQGAVLIPREADLWVDADAFERMLGDSRAAEDTNLLEEADALYAGDYLAGDPYESWAEERRESLRRQWVELQHSLAQAREERGDIEGAATALRRVLHTDPCDERAARALMHLLAKHGSRSESLRVFDRLVEALRGIEVEPEARTSALRDQIAAGGLEEAPVATQTLDRVAPLAPASLEDEVGPHRDDFRTRSMEPRPYVPSYPFPMPERLIGRVPELNVAENILEHGRQALQVLLLSAPAGTGKSALAGAIVRRAQRMGYLCLAGGGYEQQSVMPLGPFHDAIADYLLAAPADWIRSELGAELTDLAEIVPELRQHLHLADRSLRAPPDQAHLFGAVHTLVRMLSARWPLLICLEDLHAADAATQDLIRFLTRQAGRLPLVIVGTFRSEGVQSAEPLAQLEATLVREGAWRISLAPLERDDTNRMLDILLEGPASSRLATQLHDATGGNPLFLEQFVLALREDGRMDRRDGVWQPVNALGEVLPPVTLAIIGQRFDRLRPRCRETLAMAAVLGREVDHTILVAAMADRNEAELLEDLEEALTTQLIHEVPQGYAFAHGLLRESLYSSMSGPRRLIMHARAAAGLEALANVGEHKRSSELAHHFYLAGSSRPMRLKALHYSLHAGREAATLFSHRESLRHYDHVAALVEELDDSDRATCAEAAIQRARSARSLGLWPLALAHARDLQHLTEDSVQRAEAYEISGFALQQTGEMSAALQEYDAGLAVLELQDADPGRARQRLRIQQQQAQIWYMRGQGHTLLALGEEMLSSAMVLSEPEPYIAGHATIASANILLGQVESGVTANTQARDMALQLGDAVELAIRESNLAIDQFLAAQFTVAREGLERAVELFRGVAAEYRAVNSLLWLGRVGLAEGDLKRAKRDAELALDLAREAGARFIPDCHDVIGAVRIAESNWDAAESSFRQALSMRNRTDHLAGCICSLIGLGEVHEHRGVWAEARSCYAEAVGIGQQMDPSPHLVGAKRHLGMLLHMLSERENARAELEAAMTLASSMASSVEYPPMLLAAATVNWQELQLQERIDIAQKALERGLTASLAIEGHALIAQLQCTLANQTEAAKHADASVTCAESFGVAHLCAIAWSTRAGVTAAAGFAPATAVTELQRALGWIQQADSALGRERALNFARQCVAQIPEIPDEIKRALDYSLHPSLTPN